MGNETDTPRCALEDVLSLVEAAEISGISAHTLAQQAERGRLRGRKIGRTWVTTRECLADYQREHARRQREPGESRQDAKDSHSAT